MTEQTIADVIAEANPETFDVIDYLNNEVEAATEEIGIYTNVKAAKRLDELKADRALVIAEQREEQKRADVESLSIADDDLDTEYDDEINALVEELERTKITFHAKSVAPALVRAINKDFDAKKQKDLSEEEEAKYEDKRVATILAKAIDRAVTKDGRTDANWDADKLRRFEENAYAEQSARLMNGLYHMVYAGTLFESALTVDFS